MTMAVWKMKVPATVKVGRGQYLKRARQWLIVHYAADDIAAQQYVDRQPKGSYKITPA